MEYVAMELSDGMIRRNDVTEFCQNDACDRILPDARNTPDMALAMEYVVMESVAMEYVTMEFCQMQDVAISRLSSMELDKGIPDKNDNERVTRRYS